MRGLLEVCVDSLASARAAIQGGADRLELCSALAVGGLTPYTALLEQIGEESDIPIRCLMRPRAGDFLYTKEEMKMLQRQIEALHRAGASGFVLGVLNADGTLNKEAMRDCIAACEGAPVTLHRCIDVSKNLEHTYRTAHELGVDTVLTSGGADCCLSGQKELARLLALRETENGPEVLIGAGVNADVIAVLRKNLPAARAFHMSGKVALNSQMQFRKENVPMGLPGLDEWHIHQTDSQAICAARAAIDVLIL